MAKIRVVLADDHPVVRRGIRSLIEQSPDIVVAAEAENGLEALELVQRVRPDLLILDIEMPLMSGIEVARQLQIEGHPVRILALSAYDDALYVRNLLNYGIAGYLTKEEAPESIVEAVHQIAQGEQGWLSHRIALQVSTWLRNLSDQKAFSDRELEVLQLVAAGRTNQDIGYLLQISEKTVEKHVRALFHKLAVNTRVELAVWAASHGWMQR
jgi:two-component system, NarL family, nitrate/nitrite response regulator NarL